nr:hypothetical protein [Nostoc sp. ChiSLP03a]
MQSPLRPERAHDYSSAKYPQLDNPQLGLLEEKGLYIWDSKLLPD